jgi:hypothetical protein
MSRLSTAVANLAPVETLDFAPSGTRWASFYADWLIEHSELPQTLDRTPTRSHLVHELVESERALAETAPKARWEEFYAERIIDRFG